ncbi:Aste57867_5054 [Aphanomyces stellatus]|uniref:Aste57867_5054 protein n=1 Tax=Aphanomyces stellatus TaxID=120398 RepID=A0A485KCB0_9STRA|nr:hypothetical protein As57867_005041 [Aphanomyces stellatus]VFT82135.1 Aste57867_5054 [Aphanomyces stellatus]
MEQGGLHEYDLGDLVGEGSSAQVYWARRVSDDVLVAIKVLDKLQHAQIRMQSHSMMQSDEIQEIAIQRRLSHPNIVQILDVFEDSRNAFLVLEPCTGGSLRALMSTLESRAPLDESRARHHVRQLVAGMAYMHANNILHRDLKLSNILLTDDDTIKIADFGLAIDLVSNQNPQTICGTPNFIAPEVILGKPYSLAADLWSLGCIAHCLLVSHPPFQGQNVAETLQNVSSFESIALPEHVSDAAKDFVRCLLCVEPSNRMPCSSLALHPWLQPPPSKKAFPIHHPRKSKQRRTKPPAPRRERIQEVDKSDASSSSSDSAALSSSGDDADIAQLQTMLNKISLKASTASTAPLAPPPVDNAQPVVQIPGPQTQKPPVAAFSVAYHSILGADDSTREATCHSTPSGLELKGPDGEHIEYLLAEGIIRGTLSSTCDFTYDFCNLPLLDLTAAVATWVRLAQWCLGQLPVTDTALSLPLDMIESLARLESMEATLRADQASLTTAPVSPSNPPVATAELAGIGRAESLEDGTLSLYFVDGAVLQVDDCASTVLYQAKDAVEFDVYPLTTAFHVHMPSEVSRRLKYVSLFIQEMKKTSADVTRRPLTSQSHE